MSTDANWPVSISTVGASCGGTVLFRKDGQLNVTCILKSTLRFVPDEPMQVIDAEELFVAEVHYRDNPTRSIRATSDIVPYLPRVDVVLTGHACAPAGQRVTRQTVSLAIYHSIALLEKKLEVVGDRRETNVIPFERIPIIYEKALGGLGDALNPWGTGIAAGSFPPNIVHPKDPNAAAGFGPISRGLRQRKSLRGNVPVAALDELRLELPANFDWNYFQAAPADQQLASLIGNEWIVLEGFHPTLHRIASRLPTIRPIATVFGIDPDNPEVAQSVHGRIDILRINADNLTCSVISRAVIPIEDERSLSTLNIVAAVETEDLTYTHLLVAPQEGARPRGARRAAERPEKTAKFAVDRGTLVLGNESARPPALPFSSQKKFEIDDEETVDMDTASHHDQGKKPATPFPVAGPKRTSASRRTPIPGAPWSPEPVRSAKPPQARRGTVTDVTLAPADEPTRKFVKPTEIALREPPKPPLIPAAPVPELPGPPKPPSVVHTTPSSEAPVAPRPAPPPAPTKDMWAKTGTELPIVVPKPPPPRIPTKPAVNKAIYGGFGPAKKKT